MELNVKHRHNFTGRSTLLDHRQCYLKCVGEPYIVDNRYRQIKTKGEFGLRFDCSGSNH